MADEAKVANKLAEADEADAYEANNAEADEADAEVNEANETIVSDEIETNVIGEIVAANKAIVIDKVVAVNEANFAVDEAKDTIEDSNAVNEAIGVDKTNENGGVG